VENLKNCGKKSENQCTLLGHHTPIGKKQLTAVDDKKEWISNASN
jgi:hypothetical protein